MSKMKSLIDYIDIPAGGFDYHGSYAHYNGSKPMQVKPRTRSSLSPIISPRNRYELVGTCPVLYRII